MYGMAICDQEIHTAEQQLLSSFLRTFELTAERSAPTAGTVEVADFGEFAGTIRDCLKLCQNDRQKFFLLDHLSEIADVDDRLHDNEISVLEAIREAWGFDVTFSRRDIAWSDEQLDVINRAPEERVVVHAPPGAGKTALITQRIKRLIEEEDVEPSNIWLISFTRTAVRELRDRVISQSKNFPYGIRIATLDSTSFAMNVSLLNSDLSELDGYESSIESFLALLRANDPDLVSFMADLEHLFLDEAQDLIGLRKELCNELVHHLSSDCGVTVLGDRFQQIYGDWAASDTDDTTSYLELLKDGSGFDWIELKKIWRTDAPALLGLLEDLRTEMHFLDEQDTDDYSAIADRVQSGLEMVEKGVMQQEAAENYLVLFRWTKDVIEAAFQMQSSLGSAFRLRLPRYPRYTAPWVNRLFRFAEMKQVGSLSEGDVKEFVGSLLNKHRKHLDTDQLWGYLKHAAADEREVNLNRLRERIGSGRQAPVEFQHSEFGFTGPVLGTVHSSKGREAENVLFRMPEKKKSNHEEARVIFVAASRAKRGVRLIEDSAPLSDWTFVNGRYASLIVQNGKKTNWCLAETGIEGDYDPYSIVSLERKIGPAKKAQEFLRTYSPGRPGVTCWAERGVNDLSYRVFAKFGDETFDLGCFSEQLHSAFAYNSYNLFKWRKHPPIRLKNLVIMDTATMVVTRDDPMIQGLLGQYARRGTWLYPILFGLGPFSYVNG